MGLFDKHPAMTVHGERPFNAEPPLRRLRENFLTPRNLFFSRNHGPIPETGPDRLRLSVGGLVDRPLELSMGDLRGFEKQEVTAVIVCAGNRRDGLMEVAPTPGETPWGAGAIGNARWAGVSLREVLLAAGVGAGARHAAFSGLDPIEGEDGTSYGGSIPLEKALGPEVLLAYEMNGEPLAPEHGSPLRVVVPGYIGARSVKWLTSITLQDTPSDNPYQAREYKLFPPHVTAETVDTSGGLMLGETQVNAVICDPAHGTELAAGPVDVRGYALAGGGRRVERVDVSADGGETWSQADLREGADDDPWAWNLWETSLDLGPGEHRLHVRALDSSAATQPAKAAEVWNFKGYANNSWHAVRVVAR